MLSRFGTSAAFNLVYLANSAIFPTLFCSTAMGIANIIARIVTIGAPMAAEIPGHTPILISSIITGIATVLALLLKTNEKKQAKKSPTSNSLQPPTISDDEWLDEDTNLPITKEVTIFGNVSFVSQRRDTCQVIKKLKNSFYACVFG